MRLKIIQKLKTVFQQLSNPTPICKNCFNDITGLDIFSFMHRNPYVCRKCLNQYNPKFIHFKVDGVKALSLYDYDVYMKDLIYKLKGCFDYELKNSFLDLYKNELSLLFFGYTVVPAPSFIEDDKRRGFNHVVEIFKSLKLKMSEAFIKTEHFKQSDHNSRERQNIKKVLKLRENISIPKKVLLVDDIYTTGNTIRTMISLLKERGVEHIRVLVLCKTQLAEKANKS